MNNNTQNTDVPELVNFSFSSSSYLAEKIPDKSDPELANFSSYTAPSVADVAEMYNFTITEYLQEMQRTPVQIVNNRVQQIVKYIKTHAKEQLTKDRDLLLHYLDDYFQKRINQFIKDITTGTSPISNLILFFGVSRWLKNKSLADNLFRSLKQLAQHVKQDGYFRKEDQLAMKESYQKLFREIIQNIEDTLPADKKGSLLQEVI